MSGSVNRVIVIGNLTRDPELKTMPSGDSVCALRIAVNDRAKGPSTGEWRDRPNYFDVDVFGRQGENCAKWLSKGRQVAVEGRLRWREWETTDGRKRSAVSIVAENVQFIGVPEGAPGGEGDAPDGPRVGPANTPIDQPDDDDDIPF